MPNSPESIDVAVQLGVDLKIRSNRSWFRWYCLPVPANPVRVAVFAQGEKAEIAKAAGGEIVGMEDLAG